MTKVQRSILLNAMHRMRNEQEDLVQAKAQAEAMSDATISQLRKQLELATESANAHIEKLESDLAHVSSEARQHKDSNRELAAEIVCRMNTFSNSSIIRLKATMTEEYNRLQQQLELLTPSPKPTPPKDSRHKVASTCNVMPSPIAS